VDVASLLQKKLALSSMDASQTVPLGLWVLFSTRDVTFRYADAV